MQEAIRKYLSNKREYLYRGKHYYKIKNYKRYYYILKEAVETLSSAPKEVVLEQNHQHKTYRGLIKWDSVRNHIMVSENKVRVLYEPYDLV